jgi:hypothetical protein
MKISNFSQNTHILSESQNKKHFFNISKAYLQKIGKLNSSIIYFKRYKMYITNPLILLSISLKS